MALHDISLFADAVGLVFVSLSSGGTEITTQDSRRSADIDGYSVARGQFAIDLASGVITCRIEASIDGATTWQTLVPDFPAPGAANANGVSDWGLIPYSLRGSVILRGILTGNGLLSPTLKYMSLQVA